jgi:hypothetical protein
MYGSGPGMAPMQGRQQGPPNNGHGPSGGKSVEFKEGKIFLGGLNYATTQEGLTEYCKKWCAAASEDHGHEIAALAFSVLVEAMISLT